MTPRHWNDLLARAGRVVEAAIAELPREIRAEAQKVPCLFEPVCEDDPELLGRYGDFTLNEVSVANGPILLYLATIEDYCRDEQVPFEEEVRITYLHELGHHLGWDENDLDERGLG